MNNARSRKKPRETPATPMQKKKSGGRPVTIEPPEMEDLGGPSSSQPTRRHKPKLRVSGDSRKRVFQKNLKQLIEVQRLRGPEAATEIGVPYKWLWRIGAKGIGRLDDRNAANLEKLANHFCLSSVDDLWRRDLVAELLDRDEGQPFFEKFEIQLKELYAEENARLEAIDMKRLSAMRRAIYGPPAISMPADRSDTVKFLRAAKLEGLIPLYEKYCREQGESSSISEGQRAMTG